MTEQTTHQTKNIWIISFQDNSQSDLRLERVAADSLQEALSFYNDIGHSRIVGIERTRDKVTYKYKF